MGASTQPIDLRQLYGHKYRIAHDPAATLEPGGRRDPWYFVIPGRYGEIYPFSDRQLAAMVVGSRKVVEFKRRRFTPHQDAAGEAVFLFSPERFEQVAEIVKPRRRRRLTPEQKKAQIERLRPFNFRPKQRRSA